jgi:toluene monooxygenase system ferredoxin subunit
VAFRRACSLDDLWEGEMALLKVEDDEVLLVHLEDAEVLAFDPRCPHQGWPLAEGALDGTILTCGMHGWEFDVRSGEGVNPAGCRLTRYAVEKRGDDVFVDVRESES